MNDADFLRELGTISFVTRLKRVSDAMLHDGRRLYKQLGYDIEPNWFVVFKLLERHTELTVTEIADRIGFAHPSVIAIVNKMVKAGYLAEKKSPADSRKRILSLTDKARAKMPEFERVWEAGTAGVKKMLESADAYAFLETLENKIAERGFKNRTLGELNKISGVRIVDYDARYAADFARLNYQWISRDFAIEEEDRKVLDDPVNSIIRRSGQIFFALVGGPEKNEEVAGTVALIEDDRETFELAKMAVSPEFRGYNIGLRLMNACLDYAKKQGKKRIYLVSNTKLTAALNLYKKAGFKEVALDPATPYKRANIGMELELTK